ncbi:MAG: 23S rRNA (guanine1835-N2)-methyltransferase, partial [Glaciecola sp.]
MNTHFTAFERSLHLERYPAKYQHVSLQAWDGADEYIIEHVENCSLLADASNKDTPLIIINDDFGALTCWFNHKKPVFISDSWISHKSVMTNLMINGFDTANVEFCDALTDLTDVIA